MRRSALSHLWSHSRDWMYARCSVKRPKRSLFPAGRDGEKCPITAGDWIDTVNRRRPPKMIVLDMDSSESPTYGAQEGSAYNGHFGCTCYHPLFVFNQLGDLERCALRPGNVHSAYGWRGVLEPVVARYRGAVNRCYFRGGLRQPRDLRVPR